MAADPVPTNDGLSGNPDMYFNESAPLQDSSKGAQLFGLKKVQTPSSSASASGLPSGGSASERSGSEKNLSELTQDLTELRRQFDLVVGRLPTTLPGFSANNEPAISMISEKIGKLSDSVTDFASRMTAREMAPETKSQGRGWIGTVASVLGPFAAAAVGGAVGGTVGGTAGSMVTVASAIESLPICLNPTLIY